MYCVKAHEKKIGHPFDGTCYKCLVCKEWTMNEEKVCNLCDKKAKAREEEVRIKQMQKQSLNGRAGMDPTFASRVATYKACWFCNRQTLSNNPQCNFCGSKQY